MLRRIWAAFRRKDRTILISAEGTFSHNRQHPPHTGGNNRPNRFLKNEQNSESLVASYSGQRRTMNRLRHSFKVNFAVQRRWLPARSRPNEFQRVKFHHPLPIHVQVDFLPSSASLPWGAGEEEDSNEGFPAGHRSSGTGRPTPGGMSVLGDGLELTYRRSARRMGGLEASVGAVSLLDLSPGTAFSRIVSPGKKGWCTYVQFRRVGVRMSVI